MTRFLMGLWREQEGQNLPEFALLLCLVCLTAVSAMGGVATKVNSMYSHASAHVVAAASNPALTGGNASYTAEAPAETPMKSENDKKTNSNN